MKRKYVVLIVVSIFLLFSTYIFAEYNFTSSEKKYQILFPGKPKTTVTNSVTSLGIDMKTVSSTYQAENETYMVIMLQLDLDNKKNMDQYRLLESGSNGFIDQILREKKRFNLLVKEQLDCKVNNYPARILYFAQKEKIVIAAKIIVAKGDFYQLVYLSNGETNVKERSKEYFNSFKFIE